MTEKERIATEITLDLDILDMASRTLIEKLRQASAKPTGMDDPELLEAFRRFQWMTAVTDFLQEVFPLTVLEGLNGPGHSMLSELADKAQDKLKQQAQDELRPRVSRGHAVTTAEARFRGTVLAYIDFLKSRGARTGEARKFVADVLTQAGRPTKPSTLKDWEDKWMPRASRPDELGKGAVSPVIARHAARTAIEDHWRKEEFEPYEMIRQLLLHYLRVLGHVG